ncbi:MAG: glycosyltransferase family 39 protein [Candidatus Curtissbacteria bacterium]|nr:glycosyltransferase family 39 protein [Candidatus Curtissbacteria bacterium]
MLKNKLFLIIICLALVLRFYKLGQIPLSLDWDEASNAYNAYSILKTARDEYGTFLPLTNRSFDDYKPPLYMYLNVPTVAIFGLTPFAARFPSAFFGFLTVLAIYFLVKKLFNQKIMALTAMSLLTISPWHIQFSRVGFEANVGLFTAVAAVTAFLYGLKNWKFLILSSIFLGLSMYSYHTERMVAPLLFLSAFIIWRKEVFSLSKKYLSLFVVISVLIILPLVIFTPQKVILQRFETTTANSTLDDINKSIKFIRQDQDAHFPLGNIIDNRRVIIAKTYLTNYLSHFSFNFLFIKGDDNFRHHVEGFGMLYLFELPLLILGVIRLVREKNKAKYFVFAWLLISPIAAAPASPSPHAVRSLPEVIPLGIIASYAVYYLLSTKFRFRHFIIPTLTLWAVLSFLIYTENYWRHYPYDFASFWQFGYSQAAADSEKIKDKYRKINVDRSLEQAYVFWLFNTKYDPRQYQGNGSRSHFDKYYFDAKPPKDSAELFIADDKNFPQGFEIIKTIKNPDGTPAVQIGHPK